MSKRLSVAQHTKLATDHSKYGCSFIPTLADGERLCTFCGRKVYCAYCTRQYPVNALLVACWTHKELDRRMIAYEETASCIADTRPQENTVNRQSISLGFSLQIRTDEGLSIRGDINMQKTSTVPPRASKPVLSTPDVDEQYDDNSITQMPRSALRLRSTPTPTSEQQTRTTGPIVPSVVSYRVSGSTRFLLYVLLVLCCLFLFNSIVWPAINDALIQLKYGDSKIATYDLGGRHWITEETNGRLRIIASNPDGSHSQQLTTAVANASKHGLVTLKENGQHVDVYMNDAFLTYLLADGQGGYKWGSN